MSGLDEFANQYTLTEISVYDAREIFVELGMRFGSAVLDEAVAKSFAASPVGFIAAMHSSADLPSHAHYVARQLLNELIKKGVFSK